MRINHPISLSSMESFLSCILGLTTLNFHEEKNGLYEFKYPCECGPKVFPLNYEQERKLLEIGIQSLICETYKFDVVFKSHLDPQSATDHDLPTDLSLSTPQLIPAPPYFGADYSSLFVRVDGLITSESMETFENDLSSIVDLSLNFYAEEDGCYEFKFKYPHECEIFPLSHEQKRKLLNIGVQLLNCDSYLFLPARESKNQDPLSIHPQSHEDTCSPELPIQNEDVNIMSECKIST